MKPPRLLLAGVLEVAKLMTTLQTGGELSIADRAKIRLPVGDREHLPRVSITADSDQSRDDQGEQGRTPAPPPAPQRWR